MRISVLTATRGRPEALLEKGESLRNQAFEPDRMEWIVALDGPDDPTRRALSRLQLPFAQRTVELPAPAGPARARNVGAAAARGEVLLLSDDDCLLPAGTLAAHDAAQATAAVAVGGVRFVDPATRRALSLAAPARPRWWNVNGANTSLPLAAFRRAGGFDERLRGYGVEDLELGWRLQRLGLRVRAVDAAPVTHLGPDAARGGDLARAASAGRNAVEAGRRAPPLLWRLGVHPALLALKRVALYGPWVRLLDDGILAFERAYARGAREAWRTARASGRGGELR